MPASVRIPSFLPLARPAGQVIPNPIGDRGVSPSRTLPHSLSIVLFISTQPELHIRLQLGRSGAGGGYACRQGPKQMEAQQTA